MSAALRTNKNDNCFEFSKWWCIAANDDCVRSPFKKTRDAKGRRKLHPCIFGVRPTWTVGSAENAGAVFGHAILGDNMTTNGSKTLTYTVYNLPASISDSVSGNTVSFIYGPSEQLIYQTATENGITTTSKYYEGEYEEVQQGDVIRAKTTVAGVLLYTTVRKAGSWAKGYDISYVHGDHLGSTDSITSSASAGSGTGATLDTRMLFDPFGGRRQPSGADADQAYLDSLQELTFETTSNGFTGHEQIDSVTLVHMGGRMYDPTLGRFLSPDSVVQYPEISQSYNRYSYVRNNPLSLVDPSGESDNGDGDAQGNTNKKECEGDKCSSAGTDTDATEESKDGKGSDKATSTLTPEEEEYNARFRRPIQETQQEAAKAGQTGAEILDAANPLDPINALVGKAVLVGTAIGGVIKVAAKETGDLFRVVDDAELADIKKVGAFRTTPGQFEDKQFVDNLDDAKKLQIKFSEFFGGNQTIVKGKAPQSVIDNATRTPFSDIPNGTAVTVPNKDLPVIKPEL